MLKKKNLSKIFKSSRKATNSEDVSLPKKNTKMEQTTFMPFYNSVKPSEQELLQRSTYSLEVKPTQKVSTETINVLDICKPASTMSIRVIQLLSLMERLEQAESLVLKKQDWTNLLKLSNKVRKWMKLKKQTLEASAYTNESWKNIKLTFKEKSLESILKLDRQNGDILQDLQKPLFQDLH